MKFYNNKHNQQVDKHLPFFIIVILHYNNKYFTLFLLFHDHSTICATLFRRLVKTILRFNVMIFRYVYTKITSFFILLELNL